MNGAIHYANAIINSGGYSEIIAIGVNGTQLNDDGSVKGAECKAYYISKKNNCVPKEIHKITSTDWSLLKKENIDSLYEILDGLNLTEADIEALTRRTEAALEEKIKSIHQSLYDNEKLKTSLGTNEKLYLFCGLIMVGIKTDGVKPIDASDLPCNNNEKNNDGTFILNNIKSILYAKNCSSEKVEMI